MAAPAAAASTPITRRLLFALLYFSEGAPIGYIWWALPTRLRAADMPVEQVAFLTATLTLPWAFKFLWAPAVDALRSRRWGYRAWITTAQIAMGLTLIPLGFASLTDLLPIITPLLIAHAICAATQDVAIDAYAIAIVPPAERGRITGWMQTGMLVGRAIFGGLALAAEQWIGAQGVVLALIGCVWFTMLTLWLLPLPHAANFAAPGEDSPLHRFGRSLRDVATRASTWIGVAIALTAAAGFEVVGGLLGPFLLDRGIPQPTIGWFLALPVVAGMIIGALIGGWASDRYGHRRILAAAIIATGAAVLALVAADALFAVRGTGLLIAAAPVYLCAGLLTASSYALFMDLSDPAVGGTQFSAFMGATNMCEAWTVAMAGRIVAREGYPAAFTAAVAASAAALIFLWLLAIHRRRHTARQAALTNAVP